MASEQHMIGYLFERLPKLTEWEQEFVDKIAEYPEDRPLSSREKAKLEEIYQKY